VGKKGGATIPLLNPNAVVVNGVLTLISNVAPGGPKTKKVTVKVVLRANGTSKTTKRKLTLVAAVSTKR